MINKASIPTVLTFLPHFVNKILPKIKLDKKIKKELEIRAPIKELESTDDPVKSYLNTIAFHSLLKKSEETDVASRLSLAKNFICNSLVSDLNLLKYLSENYLPDSYNHESVEYDIEEPGSFNTKSESLNRRIVNVFEVIDNALLKRKLMSRDKKLLKDELLKIEFSSDFLKSLIIFLKKSKFDKNF